MNTVKQFAKRLVLRNCSPDLQHTIRRTYAVYKIMHNRHFREPEMSLIKSLVSNGQAVADIGANVGVYTNEFSSAVGPNGKVYSFEPVLENYDILTSLVRKAHLDNVSTFRVALGAKLDEREMVIPEMDGFTGYYWAHVAEPGETGRKESVKVTTLDELNRSGVIPRLDFVKCDVEGAELGVLLGGQEIIRSHEPGFLIEVSRETSTAVFGLLRDFGYRAFVFDGKLQKTETYRHREFSNYFFLHPESASWQRMVLACSYPA